MSRLYCKDQLAKPAASHADEFSTPPTSPLGVFADNAIFDKAHGGITELGSDEIAIGSDRNLLQLDGEDKQRQSLQEFSSLVRLRNLDTSGTCCLTLVQIGTCIRTLAVSCSSSADVHPILE